MNNNVVQYIIRFLLGDDISGNLVRVIGYTADPTQFYRYNVVILPSRFFEEKVYGSSDSLPALPLQEVEGVPLLFGTPEVEKVGDTIVVHGDIIAGTYFLITRYEEILRRDVRDEHGRFPGKESLLYRAGYIHRPVVDEYRLLLRRWLQQSQVDVSDIPEGIRQINLTHDIDAPFLYQSAKGFIRSLRDRGIMPSLRSRFHPQDDPYYTFPFIFTENRRLQNAVGKKNCQAVFFFKAGGKTRLDKPRYNLYNKNIQELIRQALSHHIQIGLHTSYQAGINPSYIPQEKKHLEKTIGKKIRYNRHHFLASREPEDMDKLEAAGITDDFTMGYADVAGFRLGTSYPVRWINPVTRRLSSIRLHPLIIMDCTLDEKKYMGLDYEVALAYCRTLTDEIRKVGGELTLLWHNTSFVEESDSYQRDLYITLLTDLAKK